jgi:hypothetical protein
MLRRIYGLRTNSIRTSKAGRIPHQGGFPKRHSSREQKTSS